MSWPKKYAGWWRVDDLLNLAAAPTLVQKQA